MKEAEPTFVGERSEPFASATRVNERSELILFLILNLPLTLLLHLILTLLLHLLFPSPSIVSPFPFQKREIALLKRVMIAFGKLWRLAQL